MITINGSYIFLLKLTHIHFYIPFLKYGLFHILRVTRYRMQSSCCVQKFCQRALSLATCNVAKLDTTLNKDGKKYGILYYKGN